VHADELHPALEVPGLAEEDRVATRRNEAITAIEVDGRRTPDAVTGESDPA
jgi:hypothetical protein